MGRWKDKFMGGLLLTLLAGVTAVYSLDHKYNSFSKTKLDWACYLFKREIIKFIDLPDTNRLMKKMRRLGDKVNSTNLTELVNDDTYEPDTSANEFLKNFSRTIDGARKVEKYPVEGAEKCVIYIPQIHYGEPKDKNLVMAGDIFERDKQKLKNKIINRCQKDISFILEQFIEEYNLSNIYSEGIFRDHTKNDLADFYTIPLKSLAMRNYMCFPLSENLEELVFLELMLRLNGDSLEILEQIDKLNEEEKTFFEHFRYIPGGDYNHVFDGKLEQISCANSNLDAVAYDILELDSPELTKDFIYDRREFFVLESCSKGKELYPVFIFGGIHDFKDNVLVWNRYNSDKKYSLIIVEPESFAEGTIQMIKMAINK
tara:strand:+ start:489 stop:1604 length:1116 start_codon:yes stop_codon:yes gene_type:complete